MGDEQDGDAVVAQLLDEPPALPPGGGVEAGGQLVEDDQARAADEGEGDGQALLLAAGQLPVAGVALFRQAEAGDERLGVGGLRVETGVQADRLGDGDLVGQLALLQLRADQAPGRGAVPVRVDAEDPDLPPSGWRSPSAHSTVVVLPAPFGPRMPKISPSVTRRLRPSTATFWP